MSMSLALAIIFHPELFQSTAVSPRIPDSMLMSGTFGGVGGTFADV